MTVIWLDIVSDRKGTSLYGNSCGCCKNDTFTIAMFVVFNNRDSGLELIAHTLGKANIDTVILEEKNARTAFM